MEHNLTRILDEAIKIELGISNLYQLFSDVLPEDKDFWWKLALEEVNHASILKAGKEMIPMGKFPMDIIPESFEDLAFANREIKNAQLKFQSKPVRIKAYELAYNIEVSTGEIHYQKYMESDLHDGLRDIFKQLNHGDMDHAGRIKEKWGQAILEV